MIKPQPKFAISFLFALVLAGAGTPHSLNSIYANLNFNAAQQGPARGAITPKRDPEQEKQSLKSLEAARFYLLKRKPPKDKVALERNNKAIEGRLLEIIDLDPTFSKMDEVYFLLGEVYARNEQTDEAIKYLSLVVKEYPDSASFKDAKKHLDELQAKKEKK